MIDDYLLALVLLIGLGAAGLILGTVAFLASALVGV